jgi:UDP-glucose 4-epimerase
MNVLITGGLGYVGSALAKRLLERGDNVSIVDNCRGHELKTYDQALFKLSKYTPRLIIEIKDANKIKVNELKGIDVIYHLAGLVGIPECDNDVYHSEEWNVLLTKRIIEVATEAKVKKIVFTSTAAIYGDNQACYESSNPTPLSNYGRHKRQAEDLLLAQDKVEVAIARLSNVYGVGYYGNRGVINMWCFNARNGLPVELYGSGSQVRDFIHLNDVVSALEFIGFKGSGVYNVGLGRSRSLKDVACMISPSVVLKPKVRPEPEPMKGYHYDVKRLKKLGWSPKTKLKVGVLDTLDKISKGGVIG